MKFNHLFPKNDPTVRIEYKLFEITMILTILVILLQTVLGFVLDFSAFIKGVYLFSLTIYIGYYLAYKLKVSFQIVASLYYTTGLVLLAMSWQPSGGIASPVLHMLMMLYLSGLLILPLRLFLGFMVVSILIVIGFSIYEINYPDVTSPYYTEVNRVLDLFISGSLVLVMMGLGLFFFKRAFLNDRIKLQKAIFDLKVEKEKAKAADEAKSQFLATISHEIRTPLNGVVGITELLGGTTIDSEQQELIRNLKYSSQVLQSVIGDVLDLTLIEDKKLVLQENEIRIEEEMANIIEIFKPLIVSKNKSIELSYEHGSNLPDIVFGDLIRVRQVIINLVNNAIKFTKEGFVKISTECTKQASSGVVIRFSIEDSGLGIATEKQQYLFGKFYKANTDQQIEGTGLGLSISKNLVEAMEGEIGFVSEQGTGSTFHFEVPFKRIVNSSEADPLLDANKAIVISDLKVLIAEDQPINQMIAKKMIGNLGVVTIDIAENGLIAVEKSKLTSYDFILMDLQMPEMDGIAATKEILSIPKERQPIIIAVTANVLKEELDKCMNAGMTDFITKPFTSHTIKEVLERYAGS